MKRSKAAAFAFAASLSVYLMPIVGPHAVWLLGESLFQGEARKSAQWMAANLAAAVLFQLAAGVLFFWFFRRPGFRRAIPLVIAFPFMFVSLPMVFLVGIPSKFMEEPDTAPDKASWPLACTAPGFYQTNLKTASELWVRSNTALSTYAVLTMPDCRLARVNLPQSTYKPGSGVDFSIDPTFVVAGGRALVRRHETKANVQTWWLVPGAPLQDPASLLRIEAHTDAPILSNDGRWVAWLEALQHRIVIRPIDTPGTSRVVDITNLAPGSYSLLDLDVKAETLLLWKTDHPVSVRFDGTLRKEFTRPATARPQQNTYLSMGEYWLAWDAYRDDEPYRIEWALPAGAGSHRVPLGRTIHSAALDTTGRWIAVSVGSSLSIGKAQDAVYVINAADGREVFRKYLPRYTRSPVAFLGSGFLAYSDSSGVRVLRVPD